jgi:hypothetical protein
MTVRELTSLPVRPVEAPADRAAARRALRAQVARLEQELSGLQCSAWPRTDIRAGVAGTRGAQLLSLGQLEEQRDRLAAEASRLRRALDERGAEEEGNRCLIEEMLLDPERHRWVRVSNEDIGEPGCHHWHVRPRWGVLGMLMKWWRVRISSGCPLAAAP